MQLFAGTTPVYDTIDLWVCSDCALYVANGELPYLDSDAQAIIDGEREWLDKGYHLYYGSQPSEESCVATCDCCGSKLAGNRHHIIAMRKIDENSR